jgi:hypothetical protein
MEAREALVLRRATGDYTHIFLRYESSSYRAYAQGNTAALHIRLHRHIATRGVHGCLRAGNEYLHTFQTSAAKRLGR